MLVNHRTSSNVVEYSILNLFYSFFIFKEVSGTHRKIDL